MFDLIVCGGTLVGADGMQVADIAISSGRIAAVGRHLGDSEHVISARGLHVLPGLVDMHVHFREPGGEYKEDFRSGSTSAAIGGVTTVVDMPNTNPATTTRRDLLSKAALVGSHSYIDFALRGLVLSENLHELAELADAGAAAFKLYMGSSVGTVASMDDGAIFAAFREIAATGLPVGVHAENDAIRIVLENSLRAVGRTDVQAHAESRPPFIEQEAITRAGVIAAAAGARLHIHHVSSRAGLDAVRWVRSLGSPVTCEVVVPHLLLDDQAYERYGNLVKINPPLRTASDVAALWDGIRDGTVDTIATDHAPHTDVEQRTTNTWSAAAGFIGVETLLPLLTTQVARRRLTFPNLVRLTSTGPARLLSIYPQKGSLQVGSDADLTLVDAAERWTLDQRTLHSKYPLTPFDGADLVGRSRATILRGVLIAADGELCAREPAGRWVRPGRSEL